MVLHSGCSFVLPTCYLLPLLSCQHLLQLGTLQSFLLAVNLLGSAGACTGLRLSSAHIKRIVTSSLWHLGALVMLASTEGLSWGLSVSSHCARSALFPQPSSTMSCAVPSYVVIVSVILSWVLSVSQSLWVNRTFYPHFCWLGLGQSATNSIFLLELPFFLPVLPFAIDKRCGWSYVVISGFLYLFSYWPNSKRS